MFQTSAMSDLREPGYQHSPYDENMKKNTAFIKMPMDLTNIEVSDINKGIAKIGGFWGVFNGVSAVCLTGLLTYVFW